MTTPTSRLGHFAGTLDLTRMFQAMWSRIGGVGVRTKILGIVLALTMILGLGVTWQVRVVMQRVFVGELQTRGQSVVSDLAARSVDPILLNDTFALHQLLVETVENNPDLHYAFVIDDAGRVIAHTFGDAGFPTTLLTLNTPADDGTATHLLYDSNDGRMHDFAAPIFDGDAGTMRVGMTETRLHGIVNAVTGQLLLTTLVVALIGVGAAILLTWLLTRPILRLVETTRRVGAGDLSVRAPHWANDEIGTLADAFNQMVADLDASRQAIAEKEAARGRLLEKLITAQEEERKRIARELHDGVGQALTSLIVGMKLACNSNDYREIQRQAEDMRRLAGETLQQVRTLSRQLRPSVLDDLGLEAALARYVAEFRRLYPEIAVDLHCTLAERPESIVETALYRIVQEAMTNAARHSGGTTISVLLFQRDGRVHTIVEDDGHGFDPVAMRRAERSVGIHGMSERVELLDGQLNIESSDEGTTVYVEVPV